MNDCKEASHEKDKDPVLIRVAAEFYSLAPRIARILLRIPLASPIIDRMAAFILASGTRPIWRRTLRRPAVSLIELLVVLFIMGIMLSLLLPALSGARNKAENVRCMNNMRQVAMALSRSISSTRKFPERNRWPVAALRWMEETALYDAMKNNNNPDAIFPRPPLFFCPFQEDFPSRVSAVGYCHFVLVVDRPRRLQTDRRRVKDIQWDLMDRPLLAEDPEKPQQPWFIGPEISFMRRGSMLANQPGPHEEGKYMTDRGQLVP